MLESKALSILIIEDDLDIREALTELLLAEGYDVLVAGHGQRALEILAEIKNPPALILLDHSMPIMDGPSFLREFANQFPGLLKIPILTMTAAGPADIPEGKLSELVMRKPLEVNDLLTRVELILEKTKQKNTQV